MIERPLSVDGLPQPQETPGCVVWFTGLSGAGKTTLASAVEQYLLAAGYRVQLLDGDAVRSSFSRGLGFSREDREENVRRIAFVANLLARHKVIALVAAIAPYRSIRREIRENSENYIEIYVNAPLEVCAKRDPKGLYRRARLGELPHFTGVGDPYEEPDSPDVECRTDCETIEQCLARISKKLVDFLERRVAQPAQT